MSDTAVTLKLDRYLAPDFRIVRWAAYVKLLGQLAVYLLQDPSPARRQLARWVLALKPAYTMLSLPRLVNLYERVQDVNRAGLPGAIVECGSWKGGASALMAVAGGGFSPPRQSWVFDSFQGVPPPMDKDGAEEKTVYFEGLNKAQMDDVRAAFKRMGIPEDRLTLVPGWFKDTLAGSLVRDIAVLHVDADWYEPVTEVLEGLYDRVVPGGYVIVDDYGYWPGATQALDEFAAKRGISGIQTVNNVAAYFQKPPQAGAYGDR